MLLVMVELSPPATKREIIISSKEVKNAIKDAEIMENLICDSLISRNARNPPAPKIVPLFLSSYCSFSKLKKL